MIDMEKNGRMWIETHGQARAVTIVAKNGVYYAVDRKENDEWVTVWEARVNFRQDKAHRPGGSLFQQAAHEQESWAVQVGGAA